jgi:uncharacterized protein YuzE
MRAEYDSEADALAIDLILEPRAAWADEIDDRSNVAVTEAGEPVSIEILYPSMGLDGPIQTAAARYGLDEEALLIAARAAVAAPDRVIIIEVKARSLA